MTWTFWFDSQETWLMMVTICWLCFCQHHGDIHPHQSLSLPACLSEPFHGHSWPWCLFALLNRPKFQIKHLLPVPVMPDSLSNLHLSVLAHAVLVLLDENLLVLDLLRFKLPNPLWTIYHPEGSLWSMSLANVIDHATLKNHLVPPKAVLNKISSQLVHLDQTVQLITHSAVSPDKALLEHLPIWILCFWQRIHEAYQSQGWWNACNNWVALRLCISTKLWDQLEETLINTHWQGLSIDGGAIGPPRTSLIYCLTMNWTQARLMTSSNSLKEICQHNWMTPLLCS